MYRKIKLENHLGKSLRKLVEQSYGKLIFIKGNHMRKLIYEVIQETLNEKPYKKILQRNIQGTPMLNHNVQY